MAITNIYQPPGKESISLTNTVTTVKAKYIIVTNTDMLASSVAIATFTGKPTVASDTHSIITNATLVSIDECEQIEGIDNGSAEWKYIYNVTFQTPEGTSPATATDPETETAEIDWGGADQTEEVYFDQDDVAIENTAGQPYENMPTRESGDASVTITRNESANNAALWNAYSNSINNATWYGNAAYTVKLGRITAKKIYRGSITYWRVTYPIFFKTNNIAATEYGWRTRVLSAGYCKKVLSADAVNYEWIELHDSKGQKYTAPVPLKSDGSDKLAASGTKTYTTYKIYKETTFATLALPTPF